ncbi:UDP-N-acetylenolpyruvoylglucosamine reductase [bacterium HR17]|uniref:UDP-N-acetylenolpyruvoylglucosamine reductase n=1 Tax=Candidatus Fervidibacter japonicus TaxID=2035412 RepID=A0A2H5XD34_9BACT|nr:UDP-N-acetylenolpyruvoylglucosamine reductase [bacterium HR17]
MTDKDRHLLTRLISLPPQFNTPMAEHTTLKVGGPADALVHVCTPEELRRVIQFARERDLPIFVLGEGSNLIVRDGGIRGIVLHLTGELAQINFDTTEVEVGGGAYLPHLLVRAAQRGLGGLECCTGVPGTVGGALISNAGTAEDFIGQRVRRVTVVDSDGEMRELTAKDLQFGYRWSNLREHGLVVVSVALALHPDSPTAVMDRIRQRWHYRRKTQPVNLPCAGCIFKNPPGDRAGRLLEAAGLKGVRIGDAQVSTVHANFIVNLGKATAKDVLALAEVMRQTVLDKFGIALEYEVQIVGEDG